MEDVANWTDGPEYAPVERPGAFVAPDAPPLVREPSEAAPPGMGLGAPVPDRPDYGPPPDAPALDGLTPPEPPTRDPRVAFDVVSTPLTGWGAAHAPNAPQGHSPWAPDQPLATPAPPPAQYQPPSPAWPTPQINPPPFAQPGTPEWFAPPSSGGRQPAPPRSVSVADMLSQSTPGVMIALGLGILVPGFALLLFIVAQVLAQRVRYRRALISKLFQMGFWGVLGAALMSQLLFVGYFDFALWWAQTDGWAQLACLLMAFAIPLIVGDALRRNEPPQDPPPGRF